MPAGLEVDRVSKQFETREGGVLVLDRLSLEVPRGQFVTLIGPTGCGKSTLLRIVAGLIQADSGNVSIFGESPSRATAAKHIGFVPQSPALLPWRTVLDNVRLPFQVNKRAGSRRNSHGHNGAPREGARADRTLDHGETRNSSLGEEGLPEGTHRRNGSSPADSDTVVRSGPRDPAELLETFGLGAVLSRKPRQLSVGMQQRVAIARAFVFDPSILVMDEPFSALDELTREHQRHELLQVWQSNRKTVLFVTHSVAEAVALADSVVVMSGPPGRIRAVVPVDLPRPRGELVETTGEFHEIERKVRAELRGAWAGHSEQI